MILLQSSNQDSSLEDEKAKEEDRPSSSHLSTRLEIIQMHTDDLSIPRKVHLSQFLRLQALSSLESEKLETVVICCNRGRETRDRWNEMSEET